MSFQLDGYAKFTLFSSPLSPAHSNSRNNAARSAARVRRRITITIPQCDCLQGQENRHGCTSSARNPARSQTEGRLRRKHLAEGLSAGASHRGRVVRANSSDPLVRCGQAGTSLACLCHLARDQHVDLSAVVFIVSKTLVNLGACDLWKAFRRQLRLPPRLRQTVKTQFAVR
jgi:hypothetical protein